MSIDNHHLSSLALPYYFLLSVDIFQSLPLHQHKTVSTTEMFNRDRGSGASNFHSDSGPASRLGLCAACNTTLGFCSCVHESSQPTVPHVIPSPPQHPSPQFLSSSQVPMVSSHSSALQFALQYAHHQRQQKLYDTQLRLEHASMLNQTEIERLQLQRTRLVQQIQQLQQLPARLQQQPVAPQVASPFQQQSSPQQLVPMNSGASTPPWPFEFPYTLASQIPSYQSTHEERKNTNVPFTFGPALSPLHEHYPSTIQSHVPLVSQNSAAVDNGMETERLDRVETRSKIRVKKPQNRLTDEQWRRIISIFEREDPPSYQSIANDIGCSKSTVCRTRQRHLDQTKPTQEGDS
ncbi:MAG: hypothetical protein J3Q66DRAFT_157250 [Benniella sp.]|nr:MAG: hypothetical protein J3Q66DRAFT_157250 [Benniella sp.]